MDDFERRLCAQTQYIIILLYTHKTFYISQMNPKNFVTILYSPFNYHTLPVTPLNNVYENG